MTHEDVTEFEFESRAGRLPGPPARLHPRLLSGAVGAPRRPSGPCCSLGPAGLRVSTHGTHSPCAVARAAQGPCGGPCGGPRRKAPGWGWGQKQAGGRDPGADGPSLGGGGDSLRLGGPSVCLEAGGGRPWAVGAWGAGRLEGRNLAVCLQERAPRGGAQGCSLRRPRSPSSRAGDAGGGRRVAARGTMRPARRSGRCCSRGSAIHPLPEPIPNAGVGEAGAPDALALGGGGGREKEDTGTPSAHPCPSPSPPATAQPEQAGDLGRGEGARSGGGRAGRQGERGVAGSAEVRRSAPASRTP